MCSVLLIPAPFVDRGRLVPYVPYGLLSLQAVAEEHGGEVGILAFSKISGRVFESSDELAQGVADLVESVERDEHRVVGLSTMCSSFHHSLGIAVELKRRYPRVRIWLGGPHASVEPGLILERFPEIEAVFVGEGEATFRDVIERREGRPEASLCDLPGVHTRNSSLSPRPPIADLDSLPFIDLAADFLSSLVSSEDVSSRGIPVEAERGCLGRCTFCSTRLHWGDRVRYKSSGRLIAEMDRLHAVAGKTQFSFIGDNMAASRQRLLALCETMGRERPDYRWGCSLTLDRLRSEDLDLLWAGGCRRMFVGLESGSQDTLDRIKKGIDLRRSIQLLWEALDRGFAVSTSLIVGFPWETSSHLRETYQLHAELLKRGVARSNLSSLCPLPGTDLERSEVIQPGGGNSRTAFDNLPYGAGAVEIMNRCPELFTQFGRFVAKDIDPFELRTTLRAARLLSTYHEARDEGPASN